MLRSKILLGLMPFLLPVGLFAQLNEEIHKGALWRSRAENYAAKAVDASSRIEDLNRPLVYAKLADIWWSTDRDKANQYYEKAVDRIFFLGNDEINADKNTFIDVSGQTLVLISNRNPKQSKRLVSIIEGNSSGSDGDNKPNADALVSFALSVANDNPATAAEIGILALRVGQPSLIYELYWRLNKKNKQLALKLFDAILSSARANPNISIANAIKLATFPELSIPGLPAELRSTPNLKTAALEFLLSYLIGQRNKFDSKQIETCVNVAYLIEPLLPHVAEFIPAQYGIASEAVNHCSRIKTSAESSRPDSNLSDVKQITVEVLLDLAEGVKNDPGKRSYYLFRAASLASDQEKFEQAIKILDAMTEKEINTDSDYWDSLRYTAASGLAYKRIEEADFVGASSVVDKVPESIRSFARIGLGLKCSSDELSVRQFCAGHLKTGVSELSKSAKRIGEKASFGMHAVKKLVEFDHPSEALLALESIVKLVNSDDLGEKKERFHVKQDLFDSAIDARFLEAYEQSVLSSIEKLSDSESKISGFLSLTNTSLKRAAEVAKGAKVR